MKYNFDKSSHSVYTLNYHLILCIKYRRKVLINDAIINELKERTKNIAKGFGVNIINQECDRDHTHILFSAKPSSDLVKFINSLKGATAKAIRHRYPDVKKYLWKDVFWSSSYCLITTGQVTLDQLKKYIEEQGE
ncbi:MAG: IS200/IS605 family transposase [Deltaproteobacteria bacterium]|nr:IS200/IS605 family transposase [Deltaproteobacteria bacterium]